MPTCNQCGADYEAGDRYCTRCGQKLSVYDGPEEMATQKALDISDVRYRLGMVYYRQGHYQRAVQIWEKILQERPGDGELEGLIRDARERREAQGG